MKIKPFHQQIISAVFAVYFGQEVLFAAFEHPEYSTSLIIHAIGLGWCLSAMAYIGILEVKEVLFQGLLQLNKCIMSHNDELIEQNNIRNEKK